MNLKIATHDSATGEKPLNFISWLLIPFARTQSKTIKEQYEAGCRMFDLRIKKHHNCWRAAHGLFVTKKTFIDILEEINNFDEPCRISITYEGKLKNDIEKNEFIESINAFKKTYKNIYWGPIAVKYTDDDLKVDWKVIIDSDKNYKWISATQGFLPLDGKHWQTFLPIPWLWNKIYTPNHIFNEDTFTYVDFL